MEGEEGGGGREGGRAGGRELGTEGRDVGERRRGGTEGRDVGEGGALLRGKKVCILSVLSP